MNLIFLYGPPAVGKSTIANELALLTKYKVLHMHLVIEVVLHFFAHETPEYTDLTGQLQLEIIKAVAKTGIAGLIITYGYGYLFDTKKCAAILSLTDSQIKKIITYIKKNKGKTYFVYLTAHEHTLLQRTQELSRKNTGKIEDPEFLKEILRLKKFSKIPFVTSLDIDTTNICANDVAKLINEYYGLSNEL